MDPDENLREQLDIAYGIIAAPRLERREDERLAELVLALDEWIKKGGFLPKAWQHTLTFKEFVVLANKFMENYPSDVFTGESGDPGALFVVALRKALDHLSKGDGDV